MKAAAVAGLLLATSGATGLAAGAAPEISGQLRPQWAGQRANERSPLARADALAPGLVSLPTRGADIDAELRARGHCIEAVVTLQSGRLGNAGGTGHTSHALVNELAASFDAAAWQFSVGKKIVAWDVGYGFRPNDVVAQETRRTLLAVTAEGRPVLVAEHFEAATAWSLVLVNPTKPRAQRGAEEPALALRAYRQSGAVDWHGFARLGAHTGASLGAAASWVANEAVELHASARWLDRADTRASEAPATALLAADPWHDASMRGAAQALLGGTWTRADQLTVLIEAWWDGTAMPDAAWDRWAARNHALTTRADSAAPPVAIAGNLAWQAEAFNASPSLRRGNLFARVGWQHGPWQPAIDLLFTPADRGHIVTGALAWQGDRVRVDAGVRFYGGASDAVLAQVPLRRVVYLAGTWSF